MFSNLSIYLAHFIGAALACAQLAYWSIRVMTPLPSAAPAAAKSVSLREPDPSLLARAFGLVEVATVAPSNIQVAGVFAAGRDSAAVMVVNDRPARAVLLGQEVAPGSTLVEVGDQGVTLESAGVRRELRVPAAQVATNGAPGSGAGFERRGNMLTAPSVDGAANPARTPPPRSSQAPMPNRQDLPGGPGRLQSGGAPTAQ
jgi:general secretion pathway protein C